MGEFYTPVEDTRQLSPDYSILKDIANYTEWASSGGDFKFLKGFNPLVQVGSVRTLIYLTGYLPVVYRAKIANGLSLQNFIKAVLWDCVMNNVKLIIINYPSPFNSIVNHEPLANLLLHLSDDGLLRVAKSGTDVGLVDFEKIMNDQYRELIGDLVGTLNNIHSKCIYAKTFSERVIGVL